MCTCVRVCVLKDVTCVFRGRDRERPKTEAVVECGGVACCENKIRSGRKMDKERETWIFWNVSSVLGHALVCTQKMYTWQI